jgi:hypothetical protein
MGEPAAVEPAAGEETPTGAGWVSASQRVGEAPVRSLPVQEMVAVRDTMQLPADKRPMRLLGALKDLVSELQFFQNLTSKLQKLLHPAAGRGGRLHRRRKGRIAAGGHRLRGAVPDRRRTEAPHGDG